MSRINSQGPAHPVERPWGGFWKHHPVADQALDTFVRATLAFQQAVDCDVVKLTPAGTAQAAALGLEDDWQGDALGRRTITRRPITDSLHWHALGGRGFGRQDEINLAAAVALRQALGRSRPLIATVFSPVTMAMQLAGSEQLIEDIARTPERVMRGLDELANRVAGLIRAYIQAGVDGIYFVDQHSVQLDLSSLAWLAESDWDLRPLLAAEELPIRILHLHGSPLRLDLRHLPLGWTIHYEWVAGNPPPACITGRHPLAVPISVHSLSQGLPAEAMRALIRDGLARLGAAAALISTPCVVPLEVPDTLLYGWMQAIRNWE